MKINIIPFVKGCMKKILSSCKETGCIEPYYGLGYCRKHYFRLVSNPRYTKNRILFKGRSILLKSNPRKGICSNCGKKGYTHLHHDKYDENDPLAHTRELCPSCHANESWKLGQIKAEVA